MKLWKIMLAVIVAVLMISCVAMAEGTHNHQYGWAGDTVTYAAKGDNAHIKYTTSKYICVCGDSYTTLATTEANCDWVDNGEEVKATCTTDGYQPKKCSVCQRTGKANVVKAWGHWAEDNWSASASYGANCQRKAAYVYKCRTCGEVAKVVEYGNVGDHDFTKKVYSVNTTCTQDGVYEMVCKVCGKNSGYGTYHEKAWDHNWQVYTEKASTCTVKGWQEQYCPACGATRTKELNLAAHTWNWVNEVAATCAKDGMKAHNKCAKCGVLSVDGKNIVDAATLVLPKKSGGHIVDTLRPVSNHITDCAAYNNYQHAFCAVCGLEFDTPIAPKEHTFPAIKNENAISGTLTAAYCTTKGSGRFACKDCGQQKTFEIAPIGHDWSAWTYSDPATCTKDMTATRKCTRPGSCTATETITVAPATGHIWVEVKGTEPTCTTAGKLDRTCAVCGHAEFGKTVAALGHDLTKVIETVKPTCDAQGYTVYGCSRCDATEKGNYTAALGHNYSWVVVTKPSEAGNGKNEYTCALCKKVADTKTIKYTKMYYNNTMTSFGPMTRELVGGNDWYRVTPVDLTVDGVYTYDLIASNKYIVGKVTITVNAGTLTVSYKANGVDVKDEALLIYASKADLATGTAVTAPVGAAINAAETFGADTKVLVSLILTGDYDAAGKGLVDASAAAGMIANID